MRRIGLLILVALTAWTLDARLAFAQVGDDETSVLTQPPRGSLSAQLRLKLSLQMAGGSSLAATMDHNRQEWKMLSPDERERFRSYAVAYLDKDPKAQDKVLSDYSTFLSLNQKKREAFRQRAEWVKAVAATFTPEQRDELQRMSSADRARVLVERRDELVRQGRLQVPTGEPATAPAATIPLAQE
jgi:hypothetical protein